mgnify:CR=1 FL=1
MHAEYVDCGLARKKLRNEPNKEFNDLTITHDGEAGGVEVDEEGLGEHGEKT